MSNPPQRAVPLWLKLLYTAWLAAWTVIYWQVVGPQNFLWVCDVANFLVLAALWRESALLASSQLVSVLLIQSVWTVDFVTRAVAGFHPVGGTEYMFDDTQPWALRSLSLFHVWMPLLLVWLVARLGYHRGGLALQTLIAWLVLPLSLWLTDAERNINWLHAPFGRQQVWLPDGAFLLVAMVAWPLLLYLPAHAVLVWAARRGWLELLPRAAANP